MKTHKKVFITFLYFLLIIKSIFAIMGGSAESIDYFTLYGLLLIGVLDTIRYIVKKKK